MKRRTIIRAISFLSAAVLVAIGFYVKEMNSTKRYRQIIQNNYAGAFDELSTNLNDISTNLTKISYVATPKQMATYASEIYSQSQLAKGALYKLPTGDNDLSTVYKFLSQVGNYTLSVSKDVISGKEVTDKQREELQSLSNAAKAITDAIEEAGVSYNNAEYWTKEIEGKLKNTIADNNIGSAFGELESTLSDYPTLIYDGPYSDHILEKKPLMIANAKEFSKEQARSVAKKATGDKKISYQDRQNGKIDCYRFQSKNATATVSKNGGYIVYMRKSRAVGDHNLSYEKMLQKAQEYLENMGFTDMIDTYYFTDSGICVINFAFLDGETICYTDLIKVGVAVDNGEIMLIETAGYLTNHTSRTFEDFGTSPEQAGDIISNLLTVEKTSIALIPTNGGGEVRCYEFSCKNEEGSDIIVYINTKNLDVEQVYILLKTDGGTLVK
ncbi:MAG: germination protein YpeB [Clostridia bacterium]|nr:germination protein YpeB [Clostridia bacterium]